MSIDTRKKCVCCKKKVPPHRIFEMRLFETAPGVKICDTCIIVDRVGVEIYHSGHRISGLVKEKAFMKSWKWRRGQDWFS